NYQWNPVITTTTEEDVTGEDGTTVEGTLTSNETHYPVVDYSVYKQFICAPAYKVFSFINQPGWNPVSIAPWYQGIFSAGDTGKINFVVKNNGKLVGSRSLKLTNGSLGSFTGEPAYNNPILFQNIVGSQLEISFYVERDESVSGGDNL